MSLIQFQSFWLFFFFFPPPSYYFVRRLAADPDLHEIRMPASLTLDGVTSFLWAACILLSTDETFRASVNRRKLPMQYIYAIPVCLSRHINIYIYIYRSPIALRHVQVFFRPTGHTNTEDSLFISDGRARSGGMRVGRNNSLDPILQTWVILDFRYEIQRERRKKNEILYREF